jgi:hypothetical protein
MIDTTPYEACPFKREERDRSRFRRFTKHERLVSAFHNMSYKARRFQHQRADLEAGKN